MKKSIFLFYCLLAYLCSATTLFAQQNDVLIPGVKKIKDVIIYKDTMFYSAFPSAVRLSNGEILVSFRRAPDRKVFKEKKNNHLDPNSYLVVVRSKDGEHWTKEPELLYAHPFGGSQDPCLLKLKDGTLLCASYLWTFIRPDGLAVLKKLFVQNTDAVFAGGYLLRSYDDGRTWNDLIIPCSVPSEINYSGLGCKLPAYNRGALYEGKDGRIFWAVVASDTEALRNTSVYLLISKDKGKTWEYGTKIAKDKKVSFNETSMYETPNGDLIAFMRSEAFGDQACIARSIDGGKTFGEWKSMGFKGHPLQAMRLPDNRVLLTYGYRHEPCGVRARILNAECTDFATAPEIIIRDDADNGDVGYTWAVQLDEKRVLVVYYINFDRAKGTRHIQGSILEIEPQG